MPWGEFLTYVGQGAIIVMLLVFVVAVAVGIRQAVRSAPAPRLRADDPDHEVHERLLSMDDPRRYVGDDATDDPR
jgi:hypothetical protein